ncbi:MAG TPA: aminotransferase class IV [Planctomycetota bacterium]|nr:aminotransferase class IV [Planctomycetota bacterium]
MPDVAYLNGKFMPLRAARVPVMDRGFLFGDGVYEVIRATGLRPFLVDEHLRRLQSSARMLELACPPNALLRRVIREILRRCRYERSYVYIEVTRGVTYPRKHHYPPEDTPPTVLVAGWAMGPERPEDFVRGVSCITVEDFRWGRCDIKSVNLLPNCMGKEAARRRGAAEAIFVRNGLLIEGGSSSILVVRRGRLLMPRLGQEILPSLTRALVLKIAKRRRIPAVIRPVTVREMFAADEVIIASTTAEGVPVVKIDGRRIGSGRPGPVAAVLHEEIVRAREGRR